MRIPASPHTPVTLVGRDRELGVLHEHLDAALAGQGSLVLIGGEAGIGKTALAETLCREAAERGALVLVGRCYDLTETPPYGPWVELFGRYQRPATLLLDDMQWADPASLDLLRFVARTLSDHQLLALAVYRVDELTRRHPLFALLPLLVRESAADRLDLRRLTADAVRALAATRYGLPEADETRLVDYLEPRAEGNALFTGEMLRSLEEQGALAWDRAGWVFLDTSHVQVPTLLKQVIEGRVARLGEGARHLLGVAGVIGQEVPLAIWAAVAEVDEKALAAVVERAADAHLLEETPDGTHARFAHALIRATLFEDILPSRRRRLHRQVAEALEQLPAPDFDALAYHYRQAGDERAERWLVVAGVRARYAGALLTASERFEAALRLLEERGGPAAERGWLCLYLSWVHQARDPRRTLPHLDEAARVAANVADPALTALTTLSRGAHRCQVGQVRGGIDELMRGAALLRGIASEERPWLRGSASPPTASGALTFRVAPVEGNELVVVWLAIAGRVTEACQIGEGLIAASVAGEARLEARLSEPVGRPGVGPDTWHGLAGAYATLGRPAEARMAFREAHAGFSERGNQMAVYAALAGELRYLLLPYATERVDERQGLTADAERAWVRAIEARPDLPDVVVRFPIFRVEGHWPLVRDLVAAMPRTASGFAARMRGGLGPFAYWQGDGEIARMLVDEVLPDGPATEPGDCRFADAIELQRVAAGLAMEAGDRDTARKWLEAHDRWLAWSGSVLGLPEGQLAWAAYYRMAGDADQARAHAERALVYAAEPRQPLALIAAHRLLGELDTDAGRFAAAAHLNDSLVLADACAAPFDRALTLVALAERHAMTGQREAALPLLDEVRRIATPLHALPLLAHADALAARLEAAKEPPPTYPAGLSEREVDVLRLLAAGRTNREIAAALFLSANTVRTHVTHILTKTNTDNRAAAAAFAQRHTLT